MKFLSFTVQSYSTLQLWYEKSAQLGINSWGDFSNKGARMMVFTWGEWKHRRWARSWMMN
jgi:hypothetical protein